MIGCPVAISSAELTIFYGFLIVTVFGVLNYNALFRLCLRSRTATLNEEALEETVDLILGKDWLLSNEVLASQTYMCLVPKRGRVFRFDSRW